MTTFGHILLLVAFVASGYAATACTAQTRDLHRPLRSRWFAGLLALASLTLAGGILARALIVKDYQFAYVAQYSDDLLPWYYSLSALWVGQAGSLLLWCWLSAVTASLSLQWMSPRSSHDLRNRAYGIQMIVVCFLTAIMIFAADPMEASLAMVPNGVGLNPVLQHPVMLIHPPIVFLGYTLWAVPFSLGLAALLGPEVDARWIKAARPWALAAWTMLGIGILLGGNWAYEELGWGGYWAWDPVENGSLIPWLIGTVFLHAMMSWQYRGLLKKTCLATGIATFAFCQFAAFLTRSGLFSSLHAFSQSAIGWLFLGLMAVIALAGAFLIFRARQQLAPQRKIESIFSREAFITIALVALLMLTGITIAGTIATPLSGFLFSNRVAVGPAFYNNVLIPVGLVLAVTTSMAPLLRWGKAPEPLTQRLLAVSAAVLIVGQLAALAISRRHPLEIAVIGLAVLSAVALIMHLGIETSRRSKGSLGKRVLGAFGIHRKQYAGFLIHCGFMMAVVGIAGSSLGTLRRDVEMVEGNRVEFAGYSIVYTDLRETHQGNKLAVETRLDITAHDGTRFALNPAQHYHKHQEEWTTEVAIHSTWGRDFYAVVHAGEENGAASFTFFVNPMMRWLWGAGWVCAFGVVLRLWPARGRATPLRPPMHNVTTPHRRNRSRGLASSSAKG